MNPSKTNRKMLKAFAKHKLNQANELRLRLIRYFALDKTKKV